MTAPGMSTRAALIAAVLAFLPATGGAAPQSALERAMARSPAAPWLVADEATSCENDGRRVPRGTRVCLEGKILQCSKGAWKDTGKRC